LREEAASIYHHAMKSIDTSDPQFTETLRHLAGGEELLLQVEGQLVAKLVGLSQPLPSGPPYRQGGFAKGRMIIHDNFDDPLDDFADYM
jgi:antitoxin (DNA-binding transcriptional repressor) of toxin-antitoxin stability system